MKLYYIQGSCSLAPHIVLREIGIDFDLIKVDSNSKTDEFGNDFTTINPNGYVPTLQLDNGEILTEGVAIMQYLADQTPKANLVPENGTFERARLHERLNYLSTELHKSFVPLFSDSTEEEKRKAVDKIKGKLDFIDILLSDKTYLLNDQYSIADIYLFVITNWTTSKGIPLEKWSNIARHSSKIAQRKNVKEAMRSEGLLNE
jgi:glutathione S-transferase